MEQRVLRRRMVVLAPLWVALVASFRPATAAEPTRYYAHSIVRDEYGVIAPWYKGLNGQCDFRIRIAAETLKRYPWTSLTNAVAEYPAYVFSGSWQISSNGVITPKNPGDWGNGDLSQRATSSFNGLVDYYRYTGDPAAIAHVTYMADYLIDHCVTPADHPWPGLFISVPVKGKAFGNCDPHGMIQLDLCASAGQGLLRAYQLTGNARWFRTASHWGDLLAQHCNLEPRLPPWPRYANPEDTPWKDNTQTGGVTMILGFLDELIRLGHTGPNNRLVSARDAGRQYLRDKLLPAWLARDTWGRYFWDWVNDAQNCLTTPDAAAYLLNHPKEFPNWRCDARNILTLFFNRASVSPDSRGDVYSGAWAYPESAGCCGRSLWYAPLDLSPALAQYGIAADSAWARELAYRQVVLQTYDAQETGVTEDNIEGGVIVNGDWFNIAHPMPLRFLLAAMAWLPEELGASRENHIVRSSGVVNFVTYGVGRVEYSTFDAPAETVDVLRLAFVPETISCDGKELARRRGLGANGYTVKRLENGDAIVAIRHDGAKRVLVAGDDPQKELGAPELEREGEWKIVRVKIGESSSASAVDGASRLIFSPVLRTESAGARVTARFGGNQVRLIGGVGPAGGLAEVILDGERQSVPVDCWNPDEREHQVLYYKNGLQDGPHTLEVVARGAGNPHSSGHWLGVEGVQFSAATGSGNFPIGNGPREDQRLIFGYPERHDYRDRAGHLWRPGTELVTRATNMTDSVRAFWWTTPVKGQIAATKDPELYRYGVHAKDFWVNLTVGPGRYDLRLKFAATRGLDAHQNRFAVSINGEGVLEAVDVRTLGGSANRAVDILFSDITPREGIIAIRFTAIEPGGEAFVQAIELVPVGRP